MNLGERLKKLRKARGLTQDMLADRSGISSAHLSHYECNRQVPTLENFIKLKIGMGVTWDSMFLFDLKTMDE